MPTRSPEIRQPSAVLGRRLGSAPLKLTSGTGGASVWFWTSRVWSPWLVSGSRPAWRPGKGKERVSNGGVSRNFPYSPALRQAAILATPWNWWRWRESNPRPKRHPGHQVRRLPLPLTRTAGRGVDPSFRFLSKHPACLRSLPGCSAERVLRIWFTPGELRSASRQMPGDRDVSGFFANLGREALVLEEVAVVGSFGLSRLS